MTNALFFRDDTGAFAGFSVKGHSGLSSEGSDILCAAISSMAQLVINTLTEDFGCKLEVFVDAEAAEIKAMLSEENNSLNAARALINGFYRELSVLQKAYPKNLSVREKSI